MNSKNLREATHAGSWYSNHPEILSTQLNDYLSQSEQYNCNPNTMLKSIIVPHAGYRHSASTAAKALLI